MNESQRQDYLSALGIDLWYARAALPGAAPSPRFQLEQTQEQWEPPARPQPHDETVRPAPVAHGKAKKPPRPRLVEKLSQTATAPQPAAKPEPEQAGMAAQRVDQGAVVSESFNLGLWMGERWTLIADWNKDASADLQQRLACNILRALGEAPAEAPGRLLWPAFSHPEVPGRAVHYLRDLLQRLFGDSVRPMRNLIVLGAQSETLTGYDLWPEQAGIRVRQPFTLSDMAADGQLKRQLWRDLQEVSRKH